jgi:hypothetical protein
MAAEKRWSTFEEVARQILHDLATEFGLERVEPKQRVAGERSTTDWEIDAKGICLNGEGFVIVECRRYTASRPSQEQLAGLAYRIMDTGAKGGIIVSPLGIQEGGKKVANAENIISVQLDADATPEDYVLHFLKTIFAGVTSKLELVQGAAATVSRKCRSCGERFEATGTTFLCPKCQP